VAEGRHVQTFGSYGGMMRGGNTEATVVVADAPVESPPTVSHTWSAILAHHEFSGPTVARLRPAGVVVVNASVWEGALDGDGWRIVEIPATDLATDLGNPLAAAMVLAGAYAKATGLVGLDSLVDAAARCVPAYRAQHAALNADALRAGHAAIVPVADAWAEEAAR
jgi:2-oxoglutarate ferredoxin oxidoreductase subunit gamma